MLLDLQKLIIKLLLELQIQLVANTTYDRLFFLAISLLTPESIAITTSTVSPIIHFITQSFHWIYSNRKQSRPKWQFYWVVLYSIWRRSWSRTRREYWPRSQKMRKFEMRNRVWSPSWARLTASENKTQNSAAEYNRIQSPRCIIHNSQDAIQNDLA